MRTVARIGGQIKSKQGVASSKLLSIDVVSFVQKHLTCSSKHIKVISHVATITETRVERFHRDLLSVYVQCEKVQIVVFCVEQVLGVGSILFAFVNTTQHRYLRRDAQVKVVVSVRPCTPAVSKTFCSRLFATETWPFPFPTPLYYPSARQGSTWLFEQTKPP